MTATATKPRKSKASQAEPLPDAGDQTPEVSAETPEIAAQEAETDEPAEITTRTLSRAEAEHYAEIKTKEIEVAELERIHLDLKEQAADAKKEFEQADKSLRRLIASGPKETPMEAARVRIKATLLAPRVQAGAEHDVLEVNVRGEVRISIEGEEPDDSWLAPEDVEVIAWRESRRLATASVPAASEAWRSTPLIEVLSGKALLETLAQAGLETMGQLCDYTASDKRLTDLPGIGPEKAAAIADASAEWFGRHPEACGTTKTPAFAEEVADSFRGPGILAE